MKTLKISLLCLFCLGVLQSKAQYNFSKVDAWLSANADNFSGRAFLTIYKDGKTVYANSVNQPNARQKIGARLLARQQQKAVSLDNYTATTVLSIASCSKWLSAALVMTFVDEGKLKLSDTVGRFLPVLSQNGKGKITISQCLSHLTGIKAAALRDDLADMRKANNMDETIAFIAALPMEGEPGKVFHYSNVGLQIAGAVLEKISGKSFETLFQERIAQPLGMKNTSFGQKKVVLPAGGASSTAEDYVSFLTMIQNKGLYKGKRILSEASVAQMQVNRITADVKVAYTPAEAGSGLGYGYGEWVTKSSILANLSPYVSSPGLFGGFPLLEKEHGYIAVLMTYNLKNKGRQAQYETLRQLINEAVK
ncbi:serine hydrolase domain-containing protein [Pedobacter sp. KR3-3]|uniref:Serine hydrolase domain-containing protein n=1 Tax=Pedobacter albus TaxID=3113905 RepID=A0ABU7I3E8_9SPHI|nr:serine hydrolase domain-containing protein [Pedobacter sp. KR3-3]MEE1943992.1 serine hydrolase domain-containing protein [Pedobacter sp. KR3-3]